MFYCTINYWKYIFKRNSRKWLLFWVFKHFLTHLHCTCVYFFLCCTNACVYACTSLLFIWQYFVTRSKINISLTIHLMSCIILSLETVFFALAVVWFYGLPVVQYFHTMTSLRNIRRHTPLLTKQNAFNVIYNARRKK